MLDVIKTIFSFLDSGVEIFKSTRKSIDDKKVKDIGYDLFMLYCKANELLVIGDRIICSLELFASSKSKNQDDFYRQFRWSQDLGIFTSYSSRNTTTPLDVGLSLSVLIERQRELLNEILILLNQFSLEMKVVDSSLYRKFRETLVNKGGDLSWLLESLWRDKVPLGSSKKIQNLLPQAENQPKYYLNFSISYTKENKALVKKYLKTHNSRQVLDEIEKILSKFRETLEKNFSVSDVLSRVRDKKVYNPNARFF